MAAAPLYITQQRLTAVDFSRPFMTVEASVLLRRPPTGQHTPIARAEDLLNQSEIKYGTLRTGLIRRAFRSTNDSTDMALWRQIKRFSPSSLTATNDEGIARVRNNKYAFILPSVIAHYVTLKTPCDLISIDKFLMKHHYGLATPKGSGLLSRLNTAIYLLESSGDLDKLYKKWWTSQTDCNGIRSSKLHSLNGALSLHRNGVVVLYLLYIIYKVVL